MFTRVAGPNTWLHPEAGSLKLESAEESADAKVTCSVDGGVHHGKQSAGHPCRRKTKNWFQVAIFFETRLLKTTRRS